MFVELPTPFNSSTICILENSKIVPILYCPYKKDLRWSWSGPSLRLLAQCRRELRPQPACPYLCLLALRIPAQGTRVSPPPAQESLRGIRVPALLKLDSLLRTAITIAIMLIIIILIRIAIIITIKNNNNNK